MQKFHQRAWLARPSIPDKPHWPSQWHPALQAGWRKPQNTRPGAVWLVTDAGDTPLGHFVVGDRTARAVVPAH